VTAPISRPESPYPFDAKPLTDPVDRAALAAYTRSAAAAGSGVSGAQIFGAVFAGVVVVMMLGMFGTVGAAMLASRLGVASGLIPVLLILIAVAVVVVAIVFWLRSRRIRQFRLASFAAANGMTYTPSLSEPALPGMIFSFGSGRVSTDLVRGSSPRFVEFANYRYTTGSGKDRQTHPWGYIAIHLDVPLPNIVLDAVGNNGLFGSNLPARYAKHQRLSLEGDFDRYFALYCPEGYERDALYLFTPDIMARFMDSAAAFDVEIVDDWLFLYAQRQQVSTLDPATWARMFATVGAVIDKLAQWARWRDERLGQAAAQGQGFAAGPVPGAPGLPGAPGAPAGFLASGFAAPTPAPGQQPWSPPPGVAPGGRRLKRGFSWSVVVVLVVALFWYLLHFVGPLLGILFAR
jgi:hypothetical protein